MKTEYFLNFPSEKYLEYNFHPIKQNILVGLRCHKLISKPTELLRSANTSRTSNEQNRYEGDEDFLFLKLPSHRQVVEPCLKIMTEMRIFDLRVKEILWLRHDS